MEEVSVEAGSGQESGPNPTEKKGKGKISASKVKEKATKILTTSRESYYDFGDLRDKPSIVEVYAWYFYEFSSYYVQTVVIPVVFPLIISQLQHLSTDPVHQWKENHAGLECSQMEITLYRWRLGFFDAYHEKIVVKYYVYSKLTARTLRVSGSNFSAFEWTAVAWAGGLALATPVLGFILFALDGSSQTLITIAATGVGVFFCFPAGFFKITKIFIAGIAAASTITGASHTDHLGLLARGFAGRTLPKALFHTRQRVSSWLSLYAAAAGCVGSALISSFTYHMLRDDNREFIRLWVVSIFSGWKAKPKLEASTNLRQGNQQKRTKRDLSTTTHV